MKVIKLPNVYDKDLFCEDNASVLKADRIVEECIQCPFCGAKTGKHRIMRDFKWGFLGKYKGQEIYVECTCDKCGAKWESNKYLIHSDDNSTIVFDDVYEKMQEKCKE